MMSANVSARNTKKKNVNVMIVISVRNVVVA